MKIDGEPWLVAVDVLRALGISFNPEKGVSATLRTLESSERRVETLPMQTSHGERPGKVGNPNPRTSLISESGFYKLTMRAQRTNPAARVFQDWVTKAVLPALRKDGARYLVQMVPIRGLYFTIQDLDGESSSVGVSPRASILPPNHTQRNPAVPHATPSTAALHPRQAALGSLSATVDLIEQARDRIARGAPADDPSLVQLLDFAKRKLWQGEEELRGQVFAFALD